MNIINISIDQTLVGGKRLGDAIERHRKYGEFVNHLDIIVYVNKRAELKEFKISDNVIGHPTNSANKIFFFLDAIKILNQIHKKNKVDLVQCQDPFIPGLIGLWFKKIYSIKLQINFHGDFWDNPSWLKERKINRLFLWLSKFTVPRADGIRVMSEGQKEKLLSAGVDEKKIRVISTPVDLGKYQNESGIRNQKSRNIVLHVGRDDEVKDYTTLVKAFKLVKEKIDNAEFWQVGANEKIKLAMRENDFNQVNVLGGKSATELISIYHQSDIFVLNSTSESFGKVLVEANACGKPVVATATTGAKEIIQDDYNGFLVPISDAKKLAEKIIWVLENPDKAKQMGENGRKLMREKYGDNTVKIVKFWQDIINNQL